jgi:hypothetical protein
MTLDGLPGVGQVAKQQGIYVARTIWRRLEGKPLGKPFRYRDPGTMAIIGRGRAIVSFHGLRFGGPLGFLAWLFVHLAFLMGFRNRVGALISWSWAFIGRSRDQRTFTVEAGATFTDTEPALRGHVRARSRTCIDLPRPPSRKETRDELHQNHHRRRRGHGLASRVANGVTIDGPSDEMIDLEAWLFGLSDAGYRSSSTTAASAQTGRTSRCTRPQAGCTSFILSRSRPECDGHSK